MAVAECQVADGVAGPVGRGRGDPALQVAGGHAAQHGVDETSRARPGDLPGQVHRRGHGRVRADPGREQLVCPEPEHVQHGRVDLAEAAGAAGGDHRVIGALPPQRAVAELGGQGGVTPGQPLLVQQGGQEQVRVRVTLAHRAQDLEGHQPRRADAPPGGTPGPTAPATPGGRLLARARAPGGAAAGARLTATAGAGLVAGPGARLVAFAGAGLVAGPGARLVAFGGAGLVTGLGARAVAFAGAGLVTGLDARVVAFAGAGLVTGPGARLVAGTGSGRVTRMRRGPACPGPG